VGNPTQWEGCSLRGEADVKNVASNFCLNYKLK
jgi:hypothetical protein